MVLPLWPLGIGLAALVAAAFLRRRLPDGSAAGLAAGAAVVLAAVAARWFGPSDAAGTPATAWSGVALGLVVLSVTFRDAPACWLRSVAALLGGVSIGVWAPNSGSVPWPFLLLLLAAGLLTWRGVCWGLWAMIALIHAMLTHGYADAWWRGFDPVAAQAVLALGIISIVAAGIPPFRRWRQRRRDWLAAPEKLTDAVPRLDAFYATVLLLAGFAGLLGLRCLGAGGTAPGLALAAWAAYTSAAWTQWRFAAEIGFFLTQLAIATLVFASGWSGVEGWLLSGALGGGLLAWLGGSWGGLRSGECVLTFAGHLSGSAVAASGAVAIAVLVLTSADASWTTNGAIAAAPAALSGVGLGIVLAALGLWAVLLIRDRAGVGSAGPGLPVLFLLAVQAAGSVGGGRVEPIFLVGLTGSVWLALMLTLGRQRVCGWACQAYSWALLPVVVAGAGVAAHAGQGWAAVLLSVCAAVAAGLAPPGAGSGRVPSSPFAKGLADPAGREESGR